MNGKLPEYMMPSTLKLHLEIGKLPAMHPYHHIKPLVNESNIPIATNLEAVCQLNQEWLDLFPTREGKDEDNDDDEDAWEHYHKKLKHNLETVVEPILLYCASKYKQTKRTGYEDCELPFSLPMWLISGLLLHCVKIQTCQNQTLQKNVATLQRKKLGFYQIQSGGPNL